jgi:hypothetical protein
MLDPGYPKKRNQLIQDIFIGVKTMEGANDTFSFLYATSADAQYTGNRHIFHAWQVTIEISKDPTNPLTRRIIL